MKPYPNPKVARADLDALFAKVMKDDTYTERGFFALGEEERTCLEDQVWAQYGYITYEGIAMMLDSLRLTQEDVFYDLGSGIGNVCAQVPCEPLMSLITIRTVTLCSSSCGHLTILLATQTARRFFAENCT